MVDGHTLTKDGQVDPNELAKWVRHASRMGLTGEDAAKLAAYKLVWFCYLTLWKFKHLIDLNLQNSDLLRARSIQEPGTELEQREFFPAVRKFSHNLASNSERYSKVYSST